MLEKKVFIKSPMNYMGNKYKMLPQLEKYFPDDINVFVDLFTGGGDVCINTKANFKYANDINKYVIAIFNEMKSKTIDEIIDYIESTIDSYNLDKYNLESYNKFRFNNKHEFNCSFGKDRSEFNSVIKKNLIKIHPELSNITFTSLNFKSYDLSFLSKGDFVYADPPYRISLAAYNDGKRGFEGWKTEDDILLFSLLDSLDDRGIKFALSNVSEHRGKENSELIDWMKKYNVHDINYDYNNCNYQVKNKDKKTREILVTNY